jgi:hypothetical protein
MPRHGRATVELARIQTRFSYIGEIMFLLLLTTACSVHGTVLEFLESSIVCSDVKRFVEADARIWGGFLSAQPGFIRKQVMLDPRDSAAQQINRENIFLPSTATKNCTVSTSILWESRALWKSISPQLLSATSARFIADFGYEPAFAAQPSDDGYDVIVDFTATAGATSSPAPTGVIVGAVVGSVVFLAAAVCATLQYAASAPASRHDVALISQRKFMRRGLTIFAGRRVFQILSRQDCFSPIIEKNVFFFIMCARSCWPRCFRVPYSNHCHDTSV